MRFKFKPPEGTREMLPNEKIRRLDRAYYGGAWHTAEELGSVGAMVSHRAEGPYVRPLAATRPSTIGTGIGKTL